MANGAYQSPFLAVMRTSMHVVLDAIGEREAAAHGFDVDAAVEVNPFATVPRPSRPSERLSNSPSDNGLLKCFEVFASHSALLTPNEL
jgi:hypothetical protein